MNVQPVKGDNIEIMSKLYDGGIKFNAIYADCIYEDKQMSWLNLATKLLDENGILYVQTDYHTVAIMKLLLDDWLGEENFINWLIYIQEWGGTSKRFFPRKHDDILMYANGKDYKFYPERIQIPKATAGTKLDKKGTGLKTPCDVFYDLGNFSTISKERVKDEEGKNIQWQKPLKLMDRLLLPVTDEGDIILDPFMGTGTLGVWSLLNRRRYLGIEIEQELFNISRDRIEKTKEEVYERDKVIVS